MLLAKEVVEAVRRNLLDLVEDRYERVVAVLEIFLLESGLEPILYHRVCVLHAEVPVFCIVYHLRNIGERAVVVLDEEKDETQDAVHARPPVLEPYRFKASECMMSSECEGIEAGRSVSGEIQIPEALDVGARQAIDEMEAVLAVGVDI